LAGFRLVRERPLAVLAWAAVIFAGRLASLTLTTAISGPYIPTLDAAVNAKTLDPKALAAAYQLVAPGYMAGAVAIMPFVAIITAAVYRAYLRPQEQRWCFLRLGRREAAVFMLIVTLNLILRAGLFVAAALIATAANLVAGRDPAGGALVEIGGLAAAVCGLIWVMIRLSLAWPMTLQSARLSLVPSWRLTAAWAWPLLGAFVLAEGLMAIVAVLLFTVCAGLSGAVWVALGGTLDQMSAALEPAATVAQVFRPTPLVFQAFEAVLLALWAPTLAGVAVSAYRSFGPPEAL
jgi:hypothetical protein